MGLLLPQWLLQGDRRRRGPTGRTWRAVLPEAVPRGGGASSNSDLGSAVKPMQITRAFSHLRQTGQRIRLREEGQKLAFEARQGLESFRRL